MLLRKKTEPDPSNSRLIKTVRGSGYAVALPLAMIMGQHVRVGNEDNLWNSKRERMTTVQQVEAIVDLCRRFGRKVATAEEAREIMKIGVTYDSVEETLRFRRRPWKFTAVDRTARMSEMSIADNPRRRRPAADVADRPTADIASGFNHRYRLFLHIATF
jgi:beta-keto acid cleavage enzyme